MQMPFARGYGHGFTDAATQSTDADYFRGHNLGLKQGKRARSGNGAKYVAVRNSKGGQNGED
jgi:hypothetical protein